MAYRMFFDTAQFQFQCGAIGSFIALAIALDIKPVSIPVWCDWKRYFGAINLIKLVFQFQCGAIGSKKIIAASTSITRFNSSVVRLEASIASTA